MSRWHPLTRDLTDRLVRFWRDHHPMFPLTEPLLIERVFGPPDAAPERSLCALDARGEIEALALIVPPGPPDAASGERIGGLRWFGARGLIPDEALGGAMLAESLDRLGEAGATVVDAYATPPYYIQPGIDLRHTGLIVWFLERGFEPHRTIVNMTVDLASRPWPSLEELARPDAEGYVVRRARPAEREAFLSYCRRDWTAHWAAEAAQGFDHDPRSLFLAVGGDGAGRTASAADEIVGFAAYETNQCLGCFGPTGVSPAHQGRGLGRRLLWATLADLRTLGRRRAEIGWVGPVDFYYRAAGATLGPVFWALRRRL